MPIFAEYSRCYDLLYAGKDYKAEAAYVAKLVRSVSPGATKLLELGCGTGKHAGYFFDQGFTLHGFDRSAEMISLACTSHSNSEGALRFEVGDVRSLRVDERFDAAISLFHVMSYQTENADLRDAFSTAAAHVVSGGAFVFDCWFGPGVLRDLPQVRVKTVESPDLEILRVAEPSINALTNTVDVNYSLRIQDRLTGEEKRVNESHRMRYLFVPEVRLMLEEAGFRISGVFEWMTESEASLNTWNAVFVARRI